MDGRAETALHICTRLSGSPEFKDHYGIISLKRRTHHFRFRKRLLFFNQRPTVQHLSGFSTTGRKDMKHDSGGPRVRTLAASRHNGLTASMVCLSATCKWEPLVGIGLACSLLVLLPS